MPARLVEGVSATLTVEVVADDASIELNKQMEEATALVTEEDTNVLDPSFEDVLAAAEAKIDAEAGEQSEESESEGEDSSDSSDNDSSDDDSDDDGSDESEEKTEE